MKSMSALDASSKQKAQLAKAKIEKAFSLAASSKEPFSIVEFAKSAGVSRAYIYNNYGREIRALREQLKKHSRVIEGKKVPRRTPEEAMQIEATLRGIIEKQEIKLRESRRQLIEQQKEIEITLGNAAKWRQLYDALKMTKTPNV